MSQHHEKLADGRHVLWGKDHVLGWFLDVHKNGNLDMNSVISEDSSMFTGLTGLTAERLLKRLEELGIDPSKEFI